MQISSSGATPGGAAFSSRSISPSAPSRMVRPGTGVSRAWAVASAAQQGIASSYISSSFSLAGGAASSSGPSYGAADQRCTALAATCLLRPGLSPRMRAGLGLGLTGPAPRKNFASSCIGSSASSNRHCGPGGVVLPAPAAAAAAVPAAAARRGVATSALGPSSSAGGFAGGSSTSGSSWAAPSRLASSCASGIGAASGGSSAADPHMREGGGRRRHAAMSVTAGSGAQDGAGAAPTGPGAAAAAAAAAVAAGGADGAAASGPRVPRHTNRLAAEESPYLLQHKHNPVDWYPWGEEAFARAVAEDKPIFLSVGYATCHWCHVMERESFEDEGVAALLNSNFISIKVDREERPDVDRVYMAYVQADRYLGEQLAMPAFATVLRRIAALWRTNRREMRDKAASTLLQLTEALQPATAASTSAPTGSSSTSASTTGSSSSSARDSLAALAGAAVEGCAADLGRRYDGEWGGFGGAPKFPRPCELQLLLRAQARLAEAGDVLGSSRLLGMALHSLRAMSGGGMWDVVGGGFHRYSVDELWHVPHFEKMLYDNPQMAGAYLAAWQLTGDKAFATVARGVLDYLLRDMTSPAGGLYSAEDADSALPPPPQVSAAAAAAASASGGAEAEAAGGGGRGGEVEKREGAFYVWEHGEVMAVLGPELGALFCAAYGIEEMGNCDRSDRSDPHGEFERKNVPYAAMAPEAAAEQLGLTQYGGPAAAERALAAAREKLHAARAARPRPSLDDKVVTAWNGMGIGAFALASRALASEQNVERLFPSEGRPAAAYLSAAAATAAFVRQQLWDPAAGRLRRSYCRGPSAVPGFADDYAGLISGLLDLYEAGGGREWLEWAMQLQDAQDELFWDPASGGYYSTPDPASPDADPSIRIRIKDDYDGAEPSASAVAAANLMRLAGLVPERPQPGGGGAAGGAGGGGAPLPYEEAAARTLSAFSGRLAQTPLAVPQLCCAAHLYTRRPLRQVIVAGRPDAADTSALLDAVHGPFCPDKVVLVVDPSDPADMSWWAARNPPAAAMVAAHFARLQPQHGQQQQQQAQGQAQGQQQQAQQQQPGSAGGDSGSSSSAGAGASAGGSGSVSAGAGAVVFICQNYTCQAPTSDPARVRQMLEAAQAPPSAAQLQQFTLGGKL
ncbi:hypothetical protein CHLRE_07g331250v5 [Chlamydomonas reinhardtii]|uniref:Spermatogenesis-associated protein 20-like TRX domain-containing protein n=1 Tax=Chlamydomonas reinhardtii TaxID=3055 RepID=A0A2K3DJW1_CHLRE|nr:uncharacterized protein CHLRE_07g331250v5 [Chlamydomonas reinhardtii]PNW80829.1 hypothetical protein CHLRE_07g331250v5 [Chlamydomonas reinhardtii]